MNHRPKPQPKRDHTMATAFTVIGVVSFVWSWIFFCSVSRLVKSMLAGYLLALFAFVVIVGISSLVILLSIRYVQRLDERQTKPHWWMLAIVFFGWAAIEWLIAHLVTLVWLGHAGSVDTVLPFTSFTPLVSHTPLRYGGRLIGYYGLSATVVVLLYCVCVKRYRRFLGTVIGLVLLVNIAMWGLYRSSNGTAMQVGTVAENVESRVPTITEQANMIVFPEYGFDKSLKPTERVRPNKDAQTYYVGSEEQHSTSGRQNVLIFGSTQQGVIEQRAKSRLIPGGEYVPFFADYALRLFGGNQPRDFFVQNRAVERGPYNSKPLFISDAVQLGSSVCASIIAPSDYQQFTKHGATILTNSAALGIFQSGLFTFQHQGMAAFMATANARPFVQSANDADAFVLNKDGQTVVRVSSKSPQLAIANITTNKRRTPYSMLGEWPVAVGFIIILLLIAREYLRRSSGRTPRSDS